MYIYIYILVRTNSKNFQSAQWFIPEPIKVKLYGYGVSKNSFSEFRDCSLFREFLK